MTMDTMRFKGFRAVAPIVLLLVWLSGCMAEKQIAMSDKQLFESIKTGMSRVEVERQLGKPVLEVGSEVYYGKPPRIEKWQSPPAPASISVVYSAKNIVESKKFYGGKN